MTAPSRASREAREEIERFGGRVVSVSQISRHERVDFVGPDGSAHFTLLNRGRAYPAPELRRVIRQKFRNGKT